MRPAPDVGSAQSGDYWEARYATGGNSGRGSRGELARFKAEIVNSLIQEYGVRSAIEFGSGDGVQVGMIAYPSYVGFDVSPSAVARCRKAFANDRTKSFHVMGEYQGQRADMGISMDVIYHLVEDAVFENHMRTLFKASERYVLIYSNNQDGGDTPAAPHVRNRKFTNWIDAHCPEWGLEAHIPNRYPPQGVHQGSAADFYFFKMTRS